MVKFTTEYNEQVLSDTYKQIYKDSFWFFILIPSFFIVTGVFILIFKKDIPSSMVSFLASLITVILPLIKYRSTLSVEKTRIKANGVNVVEFTFEEDGVIQHTTNDKLKSDRTANVPYSMFINCKESKDYIFLYAPGKQMYPLAKKDIGLAIDELKVLLKSKVKNRLK